MERGLGRRPHSLVGAPGGWSQAASHESRGAPSPPTPSGERALGRGGQHDQSRENNPVVGAGDPETRKVTPPPPRTQAAWKTGCYNSGPPTPQNSTVPTRGTTESRGPSALLAQELRPDQFLCELHGGRGLTLSLHKGLGRTGVDLKPVQAPGPLSLHFSRGTPPPSTGRVQEKIPCKEWFLFFLEILFDRELVREHKQGSGRPREGEKQTHRGLQGPRSRLDPRMLES